jgi:hypothetical protein
MIEKGRGHLPLLRVLALLVPLLLLLLNADLLSQPNHESSACSSGVLLLLMPCSSSVFKFHNLTLVKNVKWM